MEQDPMMKWFAYSHLPERLQGISRHFHGLADTICQLIPAQSAERTVALRKLLESKDAAVRAAIQ